MEGNEETADDEVTVAAGRVSSGQELRAAGLGKTKNTVNMGIRFAHFVQHSTIRRSLDVLTRIQNSNSKYWSLGDSTASSDSTSLQNCWSHASSARLSGMSLFLW